jgi:hypothetical protein
MTSDPAPVDTTSKTSKPATGAGLDSTTPAAPAGSWFYCMGARHGSPAVEIYSMSRFIQVVTPPDSCPICPTCGEQTPCVPVNGNTDKDVPQTVVDAMGRMNQKIVRS